jgi:hypothetical protein
MSTRYGEVDEEVARKFVDWGTELFEREFIRRLVDRYPNLDSLIFDRISDEFMQLQTALNDFLYSIVDIARTDYVVEAIRKTKIKVLVSALCAEDATDELYDLTYDDIIDNYRILDEQEEELDIYDVEEA